LQHRVLFWGIVGALAMRAVCILAGVAALQRFHWLMYVFGAILIYGGIKTALKKDDEEDDPSKGAIAKLVRRFMPVTDKLDGDRFFTRVDGKLAATPLFLALVTVEVSDVIFAVDSIPAVLAISMDTFIVYTSNVFAILGLRSIYFALAHMMRLFRYLKYALSVILIFVGIKIAGSAFFKVPTEVALGVILGLLALAVLASMLIKPRQASEPAA
jgi:tellurite resistance protein TerC